MKIKQPGTHLDHMLRHTRLHHVQLSTMADMKANMLLTISSVVITLCLPHLFDPALKWAVMVLAGFSLVTVGLAAYAVMPKLPLRPRHSVRPDVSLPTFNLLYFGDFTRLEYAEYEAAMEEVLNDSSRVYEVQVREIYTLGTFLARKKYRYLRLAYLTFFTGLAASLVVLGLTRLLGRL